MKSKPKTVNSPDYKRVATLQPFCPFCKEGLKGDNSFMNPYWCSCGEWQWSFTQGNFIIVKEKTND